MCGTDGTYIQMHETDYVSFSPNEWYKLSFTAVGDRLACALYAADDEAVAYGEPLISHELAPLNGSKYSGIVNEAGAPEFGTYSNSLFFARFDSQNLEETAEQWSYRSSTEREGGREDGMESSSSSDGSPEDGGEAAGEGEEQGSNASAGSGSGDGRLQNEGEAAPGALSTPETAGQ